MFPKSIFFPFGRKATQLDVDIHAELQHVNVVIGQLKSLKERHPQGDLRDAYMSALFPLQALRDKLRQADAPVYEVDAG